MSIERRGYSDLSEDPRLRSRTKLGSQTRGKSTTELEVSLVRVASKNVPDVSRAFLQLPLETPRDRSVIVSIQQSVRRVALRDDARRIIMGIAISLPVAEIAGTGVMSVS